ncbi:hypothetical protein [Ruminiclostridium cellobioparum]|jgi:hypothetical protein|uniref:hypothetical protein n=1 Tax=Ruminiclostridium cellobioparum TaxID=29355 RepID=UPI0028A98412|nr:hypothetical protein [Ruminiclostridium cellobioparum]
MSIKPMDFQVLYPKTTELSKTYNDEANKNQAVHQQQAEANRDRIDHSMKQVVARENVQGGRVNEKQQKDNNKQNEKKKKQKNNEENTPRIDIRI